MKKVSVIAILSVVIPSLANAEWEYSITDPNVRNISYSVEEITQSIYNMSLGIDLDVCDFERDFYAPVFKTSEDGETKYYKWIAPDLTKYKTSTNEDIFSLTDHGNGSIDFSVVDNSIVADSIENKEKGNVFLQKYYYINSPSNNRIRSDNGTINLLSQDFIGNSFGGNGAAVYNTVTINSITGNFIKNNTSSYGNGGAICNGGTIQTINGDFIENRSSLRYGGAIYNYGTINSITGDFVHNSANYDGGVIYNNGTIDSITGVFVENTARDGGVIYNYVNSPTNTITTINSINGNFIHNYATGLGGAIYNDGGYATINSITSNFIYNSAEYGGAIFNRSGYTINSITGDFISNSASERGGAIHNGGRLTFTNNVLFSGNTASYGGAIYNNSGRITMNIDGESCIRFDTASDDIYNYNNGIITVNGTTSGTQGRLYLQSVYNSKIDGENVSTNGTINLNNIHAYLADGQTINQSNLNIDKNSVLYAPVDSLNVNNINNKGVISLSSGTLTQNLSHYGYGGNVEISGSVVANTNQLDIPTTNNGILNLNGGNLIQNVSGTGNIVNTGSLFANADKIGQSLINNGTLTLTGGTFEQDITGTGNIIIDGNVTANNLFAQSMTINSGRNLVSSANNIGTDNLTNNGTLTLTGGTLAQGITGTGSIVISGNVCSDVNITQPTTINSTYGLTVAVDNIKNTTLNNNGTLWFSSGTLDKALSNYGHTGVSGTLSANADQLDRFLENNGILTLTGGTLNNNVSGSGNIIIDGDVLANGNIGQNMTINSGKSLAIIIENLNSDSLTNNGTLYLSGTDGALSASLTNNGTVYFATAGGVLSNNITGNGNIINNGELSAYAQYINNNFSNNGTFNLLGGELNSSISGTGTTNIAGDVTSNTNIEQSTTILNGAMFSISANNITSDVLTNHGTLAFLGGTLNENISNFYDDGNVINIGNLSSNAGYINHNLTNNGTLTLTGGALSNGVSGSGNIVINGDVTSGVAIAQNTTINNGKSLSIHVNNLNSNLLTNNGTLYFTGTGGTLTTNIGGLGTVVNNGELSADIQYITNNFSNNGTLNLLGGEINGAISGTGNITIAGDVTSNVALNQNTTINSGKSLTTSANNIVNSNITNNGTLRLSGGELNYAVNGNGNIINTGNLITDADFVNSHFANNGTLTLSSGTLAYNVTGNGNMVINGSVNASAQITQETSINNGKSLEIAAGNMRNTLTNNGTVLLSGGELNYTVNGNGTANIIGNVVNNATNSNAIEIGNGARFTTSSDLLTNNSDIINNGELNIIAGTLHNDVIGGKTVIASNAVLESSNIGNVEMNGIWNVGSNTVHTGNTTINGTVNLNITDFAKGSSEYTGGKIIANNVTLGDDAKLRLVVSADDNLVREGDSSGDLFVIQNSGSWTGNWDSLLEENARYSITYNQSTHGIRIVKTNDIIDIATENQGTISDVAVANAWINETHSDNSQIQAIIDRLNYTSQYDVPAYMELLNDLTPINSHVVSGTSRAINSALNNIISERIALLGRNGGDSFDGVGVWGQSLFNHSSQSGSSEFTGDTLGFGLGIDKRFSSKSLVGIGYALNNTSATSGTHDISATGHTFFVYTEFRPEQTYVEEGDIGDDVFANIKHKPSPLYMTGLLSYGITNYTEDTKNNIKSEYTTSTIGVNGSIGYNVTEAFDMYMGARYLKISQNDYTDTAGQKVSVKDDDIITGYFGGKYTGKGSIFVPNAHLGLSYDIKSNDKLAVVNTEHSSYQISGDSINPFGVQTGFGFTSSISNWKLSLNYDLDWHPEFISHTGRIKAKYTF